MKTTLESLKKDKQNNGFAEGAFVGTFTTVYRYMQPLIEKGGMYTLVLLPVFEAIKARLYWLRSSQNGDNINKIIMNRAFFILKPVVTSVGVGLALAGLVTQGFGVIIAGGYVATLRYLAKSVDYALEGNSTKTENNVLKTMLLGLIVGGFTLLTFFPGLALVGWSMVLASTSFIALPGVGRVLTTVLGMNKDKGEIIVASMTPALEQKGIGAGIESAHLQKSPTFLPSQSPSNGANGNANNRQAGLGSPI